MKMKKLLLILGVLLIGICLFSSCGSKASEIDENGIQYTKLKDGTYSASLENCTAEEVLVPSEYKGQKVTAVGGMCINPEIVSVMLPNTSFPTTASLSISARPTKISWHNRVKHSSTSLIVVANLA